MDFRLIVLLLVLAVHCQCVNIGHGRIHGQTIAPAVITEQGRELFPAHKGFTGWRYIPRANDIIKDINGNQGHRTISLTKCLQECHQHNHQGSSTKCIAVNWCAGQGYPGQLETDTPEFISHLFKSDSRWILLSTGLISTLTTQSFAAIASGQLRGFPRQISMENMDMRFIALLVVLAVHCECVNIGNGGTFTLTVRNTVIGEYYLFTAWRYILKEGEKLGDFYKSRKLSGKDCLEICQQTDKCIAVNYCYHKRNCHLDGDNADIVQHTQSSTNSRCILLSAGLLPGENPDDRAKQDNQWDHYYPKITLSDYGLNN